VLLGVGHVDQREPAPPSHPLGQRPLREHGLDDFIDRRYL
jgi:hypothetical protein